MPRRKQKRSRVFRQPTEAQIQQLRLDNQLEARRRLAGRLETSLDALATTFISAYDEVESVVGDWMHEQGFNKGSSVEAQLADIALMHTELSEAAEAIRKPQSLSPVGDPVAEELADCIIRIMHFGAQHGINVSDAIIQKCAHNLQRPFMHGKTA